MLDALDRGEAPYASHLLYTQMLDDTIPAERELGIKAGFAWGDGVRRVYYSDLCQVCAEERVPGSELQAATDAATATATLSIAWVICALCSYHPIALVGAALAVPSVLRCIFRGIRVLRPIDFRLSSGMARAWLIAPGEVRQLSEERWQLFLGLLRAEKRK